MIYDCKYMSTNRFFISESDFDGERVSLGGEQARQISKVLRLETGDSIVVLDNKGFEYDVALTQVTAKEVAGRIVEKRPATGEPAVQIVLFQSLLARDKFEWVLQKGTEVGVAVFVPMQADRSLLRAKYVDEDRLLRWRRIVTEAAEQSHRGRIPQIEPPTTLAEAVTRRRQFSRFLIAAATGQTRSLKDALASDQPLESVAILVGPEGGFTDDETSLAVEKGATPAHFGPRILRTETAGMIAPALILYELERQV
jgi:16S rRNA (uracil1498-N3)-methyltransferase